MPTAKKRKSGKWQCRVYDYKDASGKVHQKAFTADTKKEAERLAAAYERGQAQVSDLTVYEAVKSYIDAKEAALSPSTVRAYKSNLKKHFTSSRISTVKLSKLNTVTVQKFISDLTSDKLSPKTVRNIYGLLTSAVGMYRPELVFQVTLPALKKPELHTPSTEEVEQLILNIKDDRELYICVLLCAYGPMRRSEACAIRYDDIIGNNITVRRARVYSEDKQWIYKDMPKTNASFRTILYPQKVIDAIGNGIGYLITQSTPQALTERFNDALLNVGLPHFRLHDLRHYTASILHAIGIPDVYVMQRGGWKTDYCMKRVYRNTIDDVTKEMNQKAVAYFENSEPNSEPGNKKPTI